MKVQGIDTLREVAIDRQIVVCVVRSVSLDNSFRDPANGWILVYVTFIMTRLNVLLLDRREASLANVSMSELHV